MRKLILLITVLCLLLLCVCTASADSVFGTPVSVSFDAVQLTERSTVSEVIGWIQDYMSRDMIYALNQATDLAAYCVDINRNRQLLENPPTSSSSGIPGGVRQEDISRWLDIYDSSASEGAAWMIPSTEYRELSNLNGKLSYYDEKLSGLIAEYDSLRSAILSGNVSREDAVKFKARIDLITDEAKELKTAAVNFINGSDANRLPLTARVSGIAEGMNLFSRDNLQAAKVEAIQGLGGYLALYEANGINAAEGDPTIKVISKSQIAFTFTDKDKMVDGIAITVTCADDPAYSRTVLSANGSAVFEVSNFKADADRKIRVRVRFEDQNHLYRSQDFGILSMEGGQVFHVTPEKDNGQPYLVGMQFENRDMLWNNNGTTLGVQEDCYKNYAISFQVQPNGQSGNFTLYYDHGNNEKTVLINQRFQADNKILSFTVKKPWLYEGGKTGSNLLPSDENQLRVSITPDLAQSDGSHVQNDFFPDFTNIGTRWFTDKDAHPPQETELADAYMGSLSVRIPTRVPLFGGTELAVPKSWMDEILPNIIFHVETDLSFDLSYNIPPLSSKKPKEFAATRDLKEMRERKEEREEENGKAKNMYDQGVADRDARRQFDFYGSLKIRVNTYVGVSGSTSVKKASEATNDISYTLTACAGVNLYIGYEAQFIVGQPWISIDSSLAVNFSFGAELPVMKVTLLGSGETKFDWPLNFSAKVEIKPSFGLAVVVGMKFANVKFGGLISAKFSIPVAKWEQIKKDFKWTVNWNVYIQVEVAFIFKWRATLFAGFYPAKDESMAALLGDGSDYGDPVTEYTKQTRYIQADQDVYAFWVADQGKKPKIMMRNMTNSAVADKVLFESSEFPYIYDYNLTFAKLSEGFFSMKAAAPSVICMVSAGDWSGFVRAGGNTADEVPDLETMMLNGLKEHPNGATYCVARQLSGKLYTVSEIKINGKRGVLFNIEPKKVDGYPGEETLLNIFKINYFAATVLVNKGREMETVLVRASADMLNNFTFTAMESMDTRPINLYRTPTYMIQRRTPGILSVIGSSEARLCTVWTRKDGKKFACYSYEKGSSLEPIDPRLPADEAVVEICEEFTFLDNVTCSSDGLLTLVTSKEVAGPNGEPTTSYIRRSLGNTNGMNQQIELPSGSTGYKVLSFRDGSGNYRQYLWWKESYGEEDNGQLKEKYRIRASMVDAGNRCFSPAFTLLEDLDESYDYLFFAHKSQQFVLVKDGSIDRNDLKLVKTKTIPTLDSFIPEYPAIAQGEPLRMYFRMHNDSPVILETANIDITAVPINGGAEDRRGEVKLKSYNINLRKPDSSSVTNYDYMMEDGVLPAGIPVVQMDSTLAYIDSETLKLYTDTGADTIIRTVDTDDTPDTNTVYNFTYDANGNVQGATARAINYFMPGSSATFLANVSPNITADIQHWVGDYSLQAVVKSFVCSLSPDEGAQRYRAELSTTADGREFYSFSLEGDDVNAANGTGTDVLLAQFENLPGQNPERSYEAETLTQNVTRQNALTANHRAWAIAEHNDYAIKTRRFLENGKWQVEIQLSNEALASAPDVTPRLIAQIQYIDESWKNTGWSKTLYGLSMSSGFSRVITVPLDEITNGRKYERIRIGLVGAGTEDVGTFYDLNSYNNFSELDVNGSFTFLRQPEDLSVNEGAPAAFECEVTGTNGPYTYEWVVCYPDNTLRSVGPGKAPGKSTNSDWSLISNAMADGNGGSEYRINKTALTDNNLTFWCVVTDRNGFSVMSDKALLKVNRITPPTGDSATPVFWLILGLGSLCVIALLKRVQGRARKQN